MSTELSSLPTRYSERVGPIVVTRLIRRIYLYMYITHTVMIDHSSVPIKNISHYPQTENPKLMADDVAIIR